MRKIILIIGVAGFSGALSYAQTGTVMYNQGKVYCLGNDNARTSLYIKGHLKVATGTSGTSDISVTNTRIKLTGNLINDVAKGPSGGTVFRASTAGNEGVVEFCGSAPQEITTSKTTYSAIPSKLYNYIHFPHLEINNSNHVTLDARLAARTKDVALTKGWLVVDSETAKVGIDGNQDVNENQETVLAHLLIDGTVDYRKGQWAGKPANERGFIQVNLKIPGEGGQSQKSIVGFGIPFRKMRCDYFMFNTLLSPAPEGFLANPPITNPTTEMTAGKGYVVGIDLRGLDPANYLEEDAYKGIVNFNQRAINGYRFNRHAFASYAPANQLFGADPSVAAYQDEELNTGDITIPLKAGYNYLSNPFICPLNIGKLLENDQAQSTWGIQSDALTANPQMRNQVWVLAPNSVAEQGWSPYTSKYTYNYQVAMNVGGTYIDNDNVAGVTAIAPLQMFVIRAFSTATSITIPKDERVMGTPRFLRNAPVSERRRDDFIIEFRDRLTQTTDRASIVLRTQAELSSNKNYANVERLVSASEENRSGARSTTAVNEDFRQSLASQIYTKDASGKALTVQFLPLETTNRIVLYHVPSSVAQPLNILGLRLDTKDKVTRMWLEDSKYNTKVEMTPDMLYETYSEPGDSHERFSLRFSQEATAIDHLQEDNALYAYAAKGRIIVSGFTFEDLDNRVELYDINGRLIAQKNVNGKDVIFEGCASGIYVIKTGGNRPQTIKALVR
jgi:hypothetical protein